MTVSKVDNKTFVSQLATEMRSAGFEPCGKLINLDELEDHVPGRLSIGMECLDRELWDFRPALPELAKLGIKQARLQSGWARTEKEKGVYDFSWLDAVVDAVLELGVTPWLSLSYGNPLYADPDDDAQNPFLEKYGEEGQRLARAYGLGHAPLNSEEAMAAWIAYVQAVAARYRGKVSAYEIWNEPDCRVFFPYGSEWKEKYIELLELTGTAVRAVDPDAKLTSCVAGGVCSPTAEALLQMGLGEHVDVFCFHGYRRIPEQTTPEARRAFRSLLDKHAPQLQLWLGESGYPSYNAKTSFGALAGAPVSEEIQAKWIAKRVAADLADPTLDLIAYFHLFDFLHFTHLHHYYYGLLREPDYSRKPAFDVMQTLSVLLDQEARPNPLAKLELWPTDSSPGAVALLACSAFPFLRRGRPLFAYWYPEDAARDFAPVAVDLGHWQEAGLEIKKPIAIDVITRKVYALELTRPGHIKNAPLRSHPMLLADLDDLADLVQLEQEPEIWGASAKVSDRIAGG